MKKLVFTIILSATSISTFATIPAVVCGEEMNNGVDAMSSFSENISKPRVNREIYIVSVPRGSITSLSSATIVEDKERGVFKACATIISE